MKTTTINFTDAKQAARPWLPIIEGALPEDFADMPKKRQYAVLINMAFNDADGEYSVSSCYPDTVLDDEGEEVEHYWLILRAIRFLLLNPEIVVNATRPI